MKRMLTNNGKLILLIVSVIIAASVICAAMMTGGCVYDDRYRECSLICNAKHNTHRTSLRRDNASDRFKCYCATSEGWVLEPFPGEEP